MFRYHSKEITENMFCAGYDKGKLDACQVQYNFKKIKNIIVFIFLKRSYNEVE